MNVWGGLVPCIVPPPPRPPACITNTQYPARTAPPPAQKPAAEAHRDPDPLPPVPPSPGSAAIQPRGNFCGPLNRIALHRNPIQRRLIVKHKAQIPVQYVCASVHAAASLPTHATQRGHKHFPTRLSTVNMTATAPDTASCTPGNDSVR